MVITSGTRGGHEAGAGVEYGWALPGPGLPHKALILQPCSRRARPGLSPASFGATQGATEESLMLGTTLAFGAVDGNGVAVTAGARLAFLAQKP